MTLPVRAAVALLTATALLSIPFGCRSGAENATDSARMAAPVHAPPLAAAKAESMPGLHNVVSYTDDLVCGGVPEGKEGFATLREMGIRSVVSVDGATPAVADAAAAGLGYVHLPIGYDTVTPARAQELAQAIASLPRPIYVHCHHGKHRSATALAIAAIGTGELTHDAAIARMHVSGTAPNYTGLWAAVDRTAPLPSDGLRVDPKQFPSVAQVRGTVATMAEIDAVIDLVKQAHEAGWRAPAEHPDLVATHETERLAGLFAGLRGDDGTKEFTGEFPALLDKVIEQASNLDAAVRRGDSASAAQWLQAVSQSCKDCHAQYRDR